MGAANYLLSKWNSQGLEGILGILATQVCEEFILVDIYNPYFVTYWAVFSCVYHGLAFLFLVADRYSNRLAPIYMSYETRRLPL
jgi:hypothetical protein